MQARRRKRASASSRGFSRVNGIRHIVGRVNHTQTNGKVERFYGPPERILGYASEWMITEVSA